MAGMLGFALGAGMNALGGYAEAKMQKKQEHDALLLDLYKSHPEMAMTEEGQQNIKKAHGKDIAEAFMHIGTMAQKAQEQYGGVMGAEQSPTAGAPTAAMKGSPSGPLSAAPNTLPQTNITGPGTSQSPRQGPLPLAETPTAASAVPDYSEQIATLEKQIAAATKMLADPNVSSYLSKNQVDLGKNHLELLEKQLLGLQSRQRQIQERSAFDSPEAAAAKTTATTNARIGAETAPSAIAGESKLAAAKSGAEASAREGVENSPAAIEGAAKKAGAEERARMDVKSTVAAKAGKPWTTKDALDARSKAIAQANTELQTAGWFGSTRKATGKHIQSRAAQILASEGLHPETGQRLKDGEQITIDGQSFTWHDPK